MKEYIQAEATEIFWEWVRANISTEAAVDQIKALGLNITPQELMDARSYNRPANAYRQDEVFKLVQPC